MRLIRGLWYCEARFADGGVMLTQPAEYDIAAVEAPQLGELGIARAILRRVPDTRARWETRAPYEATDKPHW
jgi:hypothetical protein